MMNPGINSIKLSILAVYTLLVSSSSSSSRLSCDARNIAAISMSKSQGTQLLPTPKSIKNAAETEDFQASNANSPPTPTFQILENQPPLCMYPPPKSLQPPPTTVPPPPHISGPPPLLPPPSSSPPPSPPYSKPDHSVWCVAKPTVPASLMQQALDYACASGADCEPIQHNGPCYQPDTVLAHASFAFNSYWQKSKSAGGTCDFGGSAMLVTVDPSYDQCHFIYN